MKILLFENKWMHFGRLSPDLQSYRERICLGATVSHVGLDELKDVHCFPLHSAICGHNHGLLDGLTAPGKHVGYGYLSPEQALRSQKMNEKIAREKN